MVQLHRGVPPVQASVRSKPCFWAFRRLTHFFSPNLITQLKKLKKIQVSKDIFILHSFRNTSCISSGLTFMMWLTCCNRRNVRRLRSLYNKINISNVTEKGIDCAKFNKENDSLDNANVKSKVRQPTDRGIGFLPFAHDHCSNYKNRTAIDRFMCDCCFWLTRHRLALAKQSTRSPLLPTNDSNVQKSKNKEEEGGKIQTKIMGGGEYCWWKFRTVILKFLQAIPM